MIPFNFCQNNDNVINFTTDDLRYKFEVFSKNKIDALYLTERIQKEWLQTLYEYWYEWDKMHSGYFYFWPQWLLQYYNKMPLGQSIVIAYLMWKSEQHRLTPKYDIIHSLMSLFKTLQCDFGGG